MCVYGVYVLIYSHSFFPNYKDQNARIPPYELFRFDWDLTFKSAGVVYIINRL